MVDDTATLPATAAPTLPSPKRPPSRLRAALNVNTSTIIGVCLLSVPLLAALLAPFLTSADPMALSVATLRPPSLANPMGTDDLGRDVFARVLYGGRISLTVGLFSALIAVTIGTSVGAIAGYFGG